MAIYETKPRKGKRRWLKFAADEMREWYSDLTEDIPSAVRPESRCNFKTTTYVPLSELKKLAAAVRAFLAAQGEAERIHLDLMPPVEVDEESDFTELEEFNKVCLAPPQVGSPKAAVAGRGEAKELATAVRAYVAAKNEAESLIPEQETDWPDGYNFAELTTANALEDQKWAELNHLLEAIEGPPELPASRMTAEDVCELQNEEAT